MSTTYADRVQETSTTTGTGPLTLAGAVSGFQSFASAFADGRRVSYFITSGTAWEVGEGTLSSSATVLTRNVLHSSSTGSFISCTNPSTIACTMPAEKIADIGLAAAFAMGIVPL